MKSEKILLTLSGILYLIISALLGFYSLKLLIVFLGISILILLITKLHFEPFLSILIVSIILGLFLGLPANSIIDSVEKGTGSLLGHLSLILGLGAMLGRILEELGAVEVTANKLITLFGVKRVQLGLLVAAMCVSFSLFFDVAFILIMPIILTVAKSVKQNKIYLALPSAIGILTIHALFPPHPSPSIISKTFNLNMLEVFSYGIIVAIISAVLGGLVFTKLVIKEKSIKNIKLTSNSSPAVSASLSIFLLLLPVILITIPTLLLSLNLNSKVQGALQLLSNPVVALIISLILAIIKLKATKKMHLRDIVPLLSSSLKTIAVVLLINGAAGALKQILVDTKVTDEVVGAINNFNLSPLVVSFAVAALLRIALGSATISAVTTLAIVEPLAPLVNYSPTFLMLSICAGSMFCSHVNDPGFWLFKQYLNLDFKTTFRTWTLGTTIASCIAFLTILALITFTS